jgi:hypothetical protein
MKRASLKNSLLLLLGAVLLHLPATASACSVCMGDPNSKMAGAMNSAIFLLIGFITFMLACVGGFMVVMVRRANSPLPPHAEFSEMINPSRDERDDD